MTTPKVLFEDETLAHVCGHCPATVHPQVAERSKVFTRRVYQLAPNTFAAIEYVGSSVMVVGAEGAVVVGAVSHMSDGNLVAGHFEKLRGGKPIKAVVYNDSLADNYGGVEAFIAEADAKSGAVSVIAHEKFEQMLKNLGDISDIAAWRGAYQAGAFLPKGPEGSVHAGAIAFSRGKVSYIAPNVLVEKSWKGTLGGVKTEIYHFPAESDDGIVTWFPEQKTLVAGHVLFGDLLPQVYAQRGIVRDPKRWYKGIEDFMDFVERRDVEYMIPMHWFEPIVGRERIMEVLTINRDTLQFIADQSARYINKGWRPDDLATKLKLPPHLAKHPELQEHYGRLQQHVRQQYVDHLGWFEGDPTFLDPMSEIDRAQRYVDAMGGRAAVFARAQAAIGDKQHLWAAELLTLLIHIDRNDAAAIALKAVCLRQLGFAAPNATYRNWFLTSALEMEGKLPAVRMDKSAFVPEKILGALPPRELLETLKPRLIAEAVFDLDYRIALKFSDQPDPVALHLRRGVLVVSGRDMPDADARLRLDTATLRALVDNRETLAAAITVGKVVVEHGEHDQLLQLDAAFEPASHGNVPIAMPVSR
jgi:alkyl sulfatase BDS1-like metallo-beta-lactamase superfamily hydrolase